MAGKVKEFTDANFTESTKSGVTLVDFWAPWCPPCRAQGPIVEKLAENIDEDVTIAKVNVDENADVATKFGVSSIPTLVVLKDGREEKRFVGLQQEDALRTAIQSAKA
ncbi:MAG: thioredoxin [Planctomycetes bacterium]|nr:thioredoxin [Planctomycetota bacterium]